MGSGRINSHHQIPGCASVQIEPFAPTHPSKKQIPLAGKASIPDVSLSEGAFQFGRLTSGGCESLSVTLVNRGSIPASLHLDLSQHEEFHLERNKALAIPVAIPAGGTGVGGDAAAAAADDSQPGRGGQSRCSFGVRDYHGRRKTRERVKERQAVGGC